ncbi:class II fumarate hydratase [Lachnobacterium bovis]|jgi:fumarate hydratase class II|uniref:Fumarate hydratase class II n=1 Tax=Lachnobacterium bovis DSM 14045 TaxID=1122142 RepID=A0A1H3MHK8_9FIRM|nr:class II fumarate hydratase [Lachnobacterium bovis]SDY76141.1 fumarase, class II [Lachnobacterium bovis DSM 14045]
MEFRIEHDTMGEVKVPKKHFWGAQTQRSLENFCIGTETIPREVINAFAVLKAAAARANQRLGKMDSLKSEAIVEACDDILRGKYSDEFPLKVWQTGSGTQSNMNLNEVIVHIVKVNHSNLKIHPNDDVNMSQSSNDTFPTAMNMAAVIMIHEKLVPAMDNLISTMKRLEDENYNVIKIGRTHLQDAVPIRFSQEISGWRGMLEESKEQIIEASDKLRKIAIGGTAVGTGLNCPKGFDKLCCEEITRIAGEKFVPNSNKFHALTSKDGYVYVSGALKGLAANLMKIANDIRWLANGPRCGLGEITIPENEPGSSIMPGKVNPTQCEAITMIAIQVMGNDTTIGIGASQGNFELNVFMPVLAYNMIQSIRLLSDGIISFDKNCVSGIKAKKDKMASNLNNSLMLVTCLSPVIGYEKAALCVHKAYEEDKTLKKVVLELGFLTEEEYDSAVCPEKMV